MLWRFGQVLLAVTLLLVGAGAGADVPIPPLKQRVTDQTGTLTPEQVAALEAKLAAFEQRKGSQIFVLMVPTTAPESIEQYAIKVADAWKPGRKGVDDGAVLLVAKDDRALRIDTRYGLEGVIPDVVANRIVEDIMVPRFRSGDFYGGIDAGADAMIKLIDGEPLPPPQWRQRPQQGHGLNLQALLAIGFVLVFVVGGMLRSLLGRLPAAGVIGAVAGVIVWFIAASLLAAGVVGIIAFALMLFRGAPGMSSGTGRGWGGGGWGGGGGGGFGGGFGGGGGGMGGGGGASGRW
jgi:uncharacterized protein